MMRTSARTAALLAALTLLAAPAAAGPAAADTTPILVKIHADWCGTCRALDATWAELQKSHGEDARFVILDVSDRDAVARSQAEAERLGIRGVFDRYRASTGTIAIVNGRTHETVAVLKGQTDPQRYAEPIARARES